MSVVKGVVCVVTLSVAAAACGGGEQPGPSAVTVTDSAGIRVVESPVTGLPVRVAASEPTLSLGGLDGADGLFRVVSVARLSDGRWVTGNGGSQEIRIFTETGELDAVMGREGDGPGEFQGLTSVQVLPGDTLYAVDAGARQATLMSAGGEVYRTITPQLGDAGPTGLPLYLLANRSVVYGGLSRFSGGMAMQSRSVVRPVSDNVLLDAQGQIVATLATLAGAERWFVQDERGVSIRSIPFGRNNGIAASGERVFMGETETPQIQVWDDSGSLAELWRLDFEPLAVRSSELDAALSAELAEIDDPGYRVQTRELYESGEIPERHPAWNRLLVSQEGELWVEQFTPPAVEAPVRWWRLDATGAVVDEVELPAGFELRWASRELVAGRVTDDLGVEYLHVYPLSLTTP